jgi:hypothetical protein
MDAEVGSMLFPVLLPTWCPWFARNMI